MGQKLLWTAVTIFLFAQAFPFPGAVIVSAIIALIGAVLLWMDK